MAVNSRLNKLFKSAPRIPYDDSSKLVFFSDCHRGEGGWADNFAKNQGLYFHALQSYYDKGFTYFELGDGEELWENKDIEEIKKTYSHIYWMMSRFYKNRRIHMLFGNHDMEKKKAKKTGCLDSYYDEREKREMPLMPNYEFNEALVLRHKENKSEILLIHGHQADFINYNLWILSRFLVRYLWKPLEMIGVHDPTSAAKNYSKSISVERRLVKWAQKNKRMLIAGHTHRPFFPSDKEPMYFNDGSCVHPRCITCMEIDGGEIMLVKWAYLIRKDGAVYVGRELLTPPRKLGTFIGGGAPGRQRKTPVLQK